MAVTIPHQAGQDADKDKPVGNIVHHFGNMLFPVLGRTWCQSQRSRHRRWKMGR